MLANITDFCSNYLTMGRGPCSHYLPLCSPLSTRARQRSFVLTIAANEGNSPQMDTRMPAMRSCSVNSGRAGRQESQALRIICGARLAVIGAPHRFRLGHVAKHDRPFRPALRMLQPHSRPRCDVSDRTATVKAGDVFDPSAMPAGGTVARRRRLRRNGDKG